MKKKCCLRFVVTVHCGQRLNCLFFSLFLFYDQFYANRHSSDQSSLEIFSMKIKELSKVTAECSIPAYCVKIVGSRHILIGGGGGSAKTGVLNQLQLFLLSYGSEFDTTNNKYSPTFLHPIAQLNCSVDTGEFANMNMDCIAMNNELERGQYLFAVGQDQFCTIYKSAGFSINQEMGSNGLTLDIQSLLRIETVDGAKEDDSYQKCVRLFRTKDNNVKMVTTGTDCYVRLWSIEDLFEKNDKKITNGTKATIPEKLNGVIPELEISMGKNAVEEMDVSPCGQILATVLPQTTTLWDIGQNGTKLLDLPTSGDQYEVISNKFKVRTLRFTGLEKGKCAVFVTAHNQRIRSSREVSHLVLWSFVKETANCRLIQTKKACKESISCLEISDCDKFIAVGTMGGSIAIFDTQTLQSLLFLPQTHSSFVTAIAFLPQKTFDIKDLGRIREKENPPGRYFLPGICANSRASLISISVDKRIMVHQLPFPPPSMSFIGILLQYSLIIAIIYALICAHFWQQSFIPATIYALLWILSFFYLR